MKISNLSPSTKQSQHWSRTASTSRTQTLLPFTSPQYPNNKFPAPRIERKPQQWDGIDGVGHALRVIAHTTATTCSPRDRDLVSRSITRGRGPREIPNGGTRREMLARFRPWRPDPRRSGEGEEERRRYLRRT
ncbi:hypothetical protein SETIT_8G116300v2 [Setaria italica]|uniref:Uncharacterized protein n=1 Tax=Setaria italica TaxID=4555 RepID=A0A368S6Q3_SETIT|nr:hypothetical protein SETIT_8G116300v2 [Setaria italica]